MTTALTLQCRPVRLQAPHWLALHALALWPHGVYLVRRAFDGSDDPLGLVALFALAVLVAAQRQRLRLTPHLGWLVVALALALLANGAWWAGAPSLASALLAALSLAGALLAWWPRETAKAPLLGLVVLALPWLATLQFYLGWPLRVLTAQLSAWALTLSGFVAERSGASMLVSGQLVIVDAPCSTILPSCAERRGSGSSCWPATCCATACWWRWSRARRGSRPHGTKRSASQCWPPCVPRCGR
jgi:hypothetical protein